MWSAVVLLRPVARALSSAVGGRAVAGVGVRRAMASGLYRSMGEEDDAARAMAGGVRSDGTTKRFYKHVGVTPNEEGEGWVVTLDGIGVKTPRRKLFALPTKPLALAVAGEWATQTEYIAPSSMPMMSLAGSAIDLIGKSRKRVITGLADHCHSDTLCYIDPEPEELVKRQMDAFGPILEWMKERYGVDMKTTNAFDRVHQPDKVVRMLRGALKDLDDWELVAVEDMAALFKSLGLSLAVLERRVTVPDAIRRFRVDELWQQENWGVVEGGHDVDEADFAARIHAARVYLDLLRV